MLSTRVGYAGGTEPDPTYRNIGGHAETLQVDFDPDVIEFERILDIFWSEHRPTHPDRASQYRSAIFVAHEGELAAALESRDRIDRKLGAKVDTEIRILDAFHRAEDYHQKYYMRRAPGVAEELEIRLGDFDAYVDSTTVARINGFLGGHELGRFRTEIDELGLSPRARRELILAIDL